MKKLKKIGKFILGLLVLFILFSFGFKIKEHFVGKKYIEYWKNNSNLYETVNQSESFDFKIFEKSAIQVPFLFLHKNNSSHPTRTVHI